MLKNNAICKYFGARETFSEFQCYKYFEISFQTLKVNTTVSLFNFHKPFLTKRHVKSSSYYCYFLALYTHKPLKVW